MVIFIFLDTFKNINLLHMWRFSCLEMGHLDGGSLWNNIPSLCMMFWLNNKFDFLKEIHTKNQLGSYLVLILRGQWVFGNWNLELCTWLIYDPGHVSMWPGLTQVTRWIKFVLTWRGDKIFLTRINPGHVSFWPGWPLLT